MRHALAHRDHEYRVAMTVVSLVCGLAFLGALVPAVEHVVNLGLLGLALLVAVLVAARLGVRFVRERIEDRADARTAVVWQALHAPHLLTPATGSSVAARVRAGVA